MDGCPPQYKTLIDTLFSAESVFIIETNAVGNLKTFAKQVELLAAQTFADVVYFAEDDYLYRPGLFYKMVELIKKKEADFASCYLHRDIFTHPVHQQEKKIKLFADHVWIKVVSTCLTFITSKETLNKTKDVFLTYAKGNNDCSLWLTLTKKHILNPLSWLRMLGNKECAGILKVAVKKSLWYYFTTKKYSLWVPVPAIGTHLEKGLESPGIDWIKIAGNLETTGNENN